MTTNFLSLEEVAKMLKVSERTVQREVKAGKLKAFRVGRALRFRLDAVEAYVQEQEIAPGDIALEDETEESDSQSESLKPAA